MYAVLSSASSGAPHTINKKGIKEKGHLLLVLVLLTLAAWIIRDSSRIDMTSMYVAN